ncbi:MAG: cytochrome P450 [Pseudomonadales bacterium]
MSQCPHINLASPDNYIGGVPFEWLRELRQKEPVFWQEEPQFDTGGYWAITKHADLDFISKHPLIFSSAERTCMMRDMPEESLALNRMILINMDPPDHIKHRRIVRNAFTPKVVDSYHERFKAIAKDIVDRVADAGHCEFVQDIAAELPLIAICELMAVPLDQRKKVFELTNIMIGADDPDLSTDDSDGQNAMIELFTLGHQLATDYTSGKSVGANTGYLMSALLDGIDGEKLNEEEFSTFFLILLVAGNETTRTVTSQGMRLLMENPDALDALIEDPTKIPNAIEEILRYHTAVVSFRRTVMEDTTLPSGYDVKKGDNVVLYYHSASRDEAIFTDPETFDISRPEREDVRNKHRAFGIGEHFCLGSHLARLELLVIFEEIIPRMRNPKLTAPVSWLRSNFINGIKEMHISFDPTS